MAVEVETPEGYLGSVLGDLNQRRGEIRSRNRHDDRTTVHALVPLANMFGYPGAFNGITAGEGSFTMAFSHYASTPQHDPDPVFPSSIGMRA